MVVVVSDTNSVDAIAVLAGSAQAVTVSLAYSAVSVAWIVVSRGVSWVVIAVTIVAWLLEVLNSGSAGAVRLGNHLLGDNSLWLLDRDLWLRRSLVDKLLCIWWSSYDLNISRALRLGSYFVSLDFGMEAGFVGVILDSSRATIGVSEGVESGHFSAWVALLGCGMSVGLISIRIRLRCGLNVWLFLAGSASNAESNQ